MQILNNNFKEFLLILIFFLALGQPFFYFLLLKLLMLLTIKNAKKEKANVSATYGGPLQTSWIESWSKFYEDYRNFKD